jgi:hypothetical protein
LFAGSNPVSPTEVFMKFDWRDVTKHYKRIDKDHILEICLHCKVEKITRCGDDVRFSLQPVYYVAPSFLSLKSRVMHVDYLCPWCFQSAMENGFGHSEESAPFIPWLRKVKWGV